MSIALRGNLRDFGISEVFQLIGQQGKTGVLEVSGEGERIQLRFDAGSIVDAAPVRAHPDEALGDLLVRVGWLTRERLAELVRRRRDHLQSLAMLITTEGDLSAEQVEKIQDLLTRESLFAVLRWQEGSFHFLAQAIEHDRPAAKLLAAEQVLMDGMRMVDEWQTFADRIPSEEAVFQRLASFESRGSQLPAGPQREQAERLFRMVDGRLSARRLIDLSRLGTFEGTRLLAQLCDAALIEALAAKPPAAERRRIPTLPGSPLRLAAASLLPLLLLGTLLWVPRLAAGQRPTAQPLVAAGLEARAEERLVARRLERVVQAYRVATGRWPSNLEELVSRGWLSQDALAGPDGRPYYYARRGGAYVLLAPSL